MPTQHHDPLGADVLAWASAPRKPTQNVGNQGTAPSNTVPSNSTEAPGTRILRTGIDTLYLSYSGDLRHEQGIRLAQLKELAQSPDPDRQALAQLELATHTFEVGDKGRSIYPYVLRDGWYQLQVSKPNAINKPMAFAMVASAVLTSYSLPFVLLDLVECVDALGVVEGAPKVSRVDLCCDFVTAFALDEVRESHWQTRARSLARYTEGKQFTGFGLGMGGALSCRLYNKTVEMKKNPRPYLEDLWRQAGWDGEEAVWRLEFQFRREVLKDFNVLTVDDLESALAGLWRYATADWLRLVVPVDTDATPSRWPTAPVWTVLQGASWSGERTLARVSVEKGRIPSAKQLFEHGLGGLTSFMALRGISDYQEAIGAYLTEATAYHNGREYFTGLDFRAYLAAKVRTKQRLFNTAVNVPQQGTHPADQAAANAYRRARDGD